MKKIFTAIGLMSGTSADGVDASIIKTDGENITEFGPSISIPYSKEEYELITSSYGIDLRTANTKQKELISKVENLITEKHISTVNKLIKDFNLSKQDIDIIGFHGQTIIHKPNEKYTLQIGNSQKLADKTGIDVIGDIRQNDIKNGGEAAPLIPIYHQALCSNINKPIAVINIGGVSNITYIDNDNLIAFDIGTGNAMINDWVNKHLNINFDKNGDIAKSGKINQIALDKMLDNDFFKKTYPKSLDRNNFIKSIEPHIKNLSIEDGAATLTEFTIMGIVKAIELINKKPKKIIICGGGAYNSYMMERIKNKFSIPVITADSDELKWNSSRIESDGFAFIAVRTLLGLPSSFTTTTNCKTPTICGTLYKTKN